MASPFLILFLFTYSISHAIFICQVCIFCPPAGISPGKIGRMLASPEKIVYNKELIT